MPLTSAIQVQGLAFRYGNHEALKGIDFQIETGEIFGLLGPNGGGKTTLFRILATILPIQKGNVTVLGFEADKRPSEIRCRIGVTFQSPSLDGKLTVHENLVHQAHLYGLSGQAMRERIRQLQNRLGLSDRSRELVELLSGGLKRRVEIAKGLLHSPQVLLLDEPSTGLDPGARNDLWRYLKQLQSESRVTILVTTHLMEEAENCDRLGILNRGELVALGTPDELRTSVGGDCLTIRAASPDHLAQKIQNRFQVAPQRMGEVLRIERQQGHELLRDIVDAFPEEVLSVSLGKPTLEDVFIHRTGHRFWEEEST